MKTRCEISLVIAACLAASWVLADEAELQRRQAAHERATEATRQVVASVLDVQLRLLEDNGLQGVSLYQDVEFARARLEQILAGEMKELAALLTAAEEPSAAEPTAQLRLVRRLSRQAAIGLLAERTRLRERLRKPDAAEREAARRAVQELREEQQQVREQTAASDLPVQDRTRLSEAQHEIAEQLQGVQPLLADLIQAGEQTLAAWDAAAQAQRHLAAGEQAAALERQETVLRLLDELSHQLSQPAEAAPSPEEAEQLEELSRALDQLVERQQEATAAAAEDPQRAREIEADVAKALEAVDDASQLDQPVEAQLDRAQAAVQQAQAKLEEESASAHERQQAAAAAEQALLEAAAEVQSQLAGMQQPQANSNSPSDVATGELRSSQTPTTGLTTQSSAQADNLLDSAVVPRDLTEEPWFARLPPALQSAIRAQSRRPPPRGYETQLRSYFQRTDRE